MAFSPQKENESALELLPERLQYLDGLGAEERAIELVRGVLAGNVFDWGAREVVALMSKGLDFAQATRKLQSECIKLY